MNQIRDTRLTVFRLLVFAAVGCFTLFLFNFQVLQGEYYRTLSEKNRIRLIRLEAPRGTIYDRNGTPLALTRPSLDVFIVPEDFNPDYTPLLAAILKMKVEDVEEKVRHLDDAPFVPVLLKRDVSKETAFKIEENKPTLTGVFIEVQGLRYYPEGNFASHVLGYLGKITLEEYRQQEEEKVYHLNDWIGRSGIEKVFDPSLRGEDGGRQIEVNVQGRQIRVLGEKEATAGADITLTLDARVQKIASQILGTRKGAVCLLDLNQGEILAFVSKPDFDPNVFVSPSQSSERMKVMMDKMDLPLLNRGLSAGFPPGSVFKLVTALAALETGKITPETVLYCPGNFRLSPHSRPFKCWNSNGHGYLNMNQAIERSCNVYFYQVGLRVGASNLARFSRILGLGELMKLELSNISEGMIPDEEWKRKRFHDEWYQGETVNFAIGQGFVLTTPLQIVKLVGTIAKEGEIPDIHIVKRDGQQVRRDHVAINPENIRRLKKAMLQVVQSDHGTGQFARVDFLRMGAKTGTAQVPSHEPHAWFSGFFPFEKPRYALVVFVEHGGPGGYNAARLAKQIVVGMKDLGYFKEEADSLSVGSPSLQS